MGLKIELRSFDYARKFNKGGNVLKVETYM